MLATSLLIDHKSKPKGSTEILVRILLCCQTLKSLEILLCEKNKPPFFFFKATVCQAFFCYLQPTVFSADCGRLYYCSPTIGFLPYSKLIHSCSRMCKLQPPPPEKLVYPSPSWQTGTCDLLKPMAHQQICLTFTCQVWVNSFKRECGEFSGGPVTKTLCSQYGVGGRAGKGFDLWSEN